LAEGFEINAYAQEIVSGVRKLAKGETYQVDLRGLNRTEQDFLSDYVKSQLTEVERGRLLWLSSTF
jgi:hypothetical protein